MVLALTLQSGGTVSGPRQVHVNLAAWSVNTNPDGTVSFRLRNTSHPRQLQRALAQAGVPALVRWNEVCLAHQRNLLSTLGIVRDPKNISPKLESVLLLGGGSRGQRWQNAVWTITPSKMPQALAIRDQRAASQRARAATTSGPNGSWPGTARP